MIKSLDARHIAKIPKENRLVSSIIAIVLNGRLRVVWQQIAYKKGI